MPLDAASSWTEPAAPVHGWGHESRGTPAQPDGTGLPRGQTIDFGWDSFRRSDTKTRMETYKIAIEAGVMTVDEARSRENMPPLGGSQEGTNTDEA